MTFTKPKFTVTPTIAVKIVEHLQKEHPQLISDAFNQVQKPEPSFNYFWILERTFNKYCLEKQIIPESIIGEKVGKQGQWERNLFMAVVFKLYSPEIYTGHYNLADGVRHELAGMLQVHETWISQQITGIVSYWNDKRLPEFRQQVEKYSDILNNSIKVKEVKEEAVNVTLFQ